MRWQVGILAFTMIIFSERATAQSSPYEVNWEKERFFLAGGVGTLGMGVYLQSQTATFDPGQLETFNAEAINAFDLGAISNYSMTAHRRSDWLLYGSLTLPAFFLVDKHARADFGTIATLWGETVLLTSGITSLSKYAFRRPRPYVYNPNVSSEIKMTTAAQASFISGHTSVTAANTFFAAKVFSDYYPDSKWKPVVWTTAAVIPAVTGYLRVRAGKHYPTDVITGYAAGAAIGYLIPHLHKRKQKENGWSFYGGAGGALLRYTFK